MVGNGISAINSTLLWTITYTSFTPGTCESIVFPANSQGRICFLVPWWKCLRNSHQKNLMHQDHLFDSIIIIPWLKNWIYIYISTNNIYIYIFIPWKSKTIQRVVSRIIHIKGSLLTAKFGSCGLVAWDWMPSLKLTARPWKSKNLSRFFSHEKMVEKFPAGRVVSLQYCHCIYMHISPPVNLLGGFHGCWNIITISLIIPESLVLPLINYHG